MRYPNKMAEFGKLNVDEQKAIEDLRTRMKKLLPPEMYDDSLLFYGFLKARDFDINKAEAMLKKHIKWQKVFQVDSMLETMKPMEVFQKYLGPQFIGFDKDGDIVRYAPLGNLHAIDLERCIKMNDLEKNSIYNMEESRAIMNKENERTGRNCYRGILIVNLDHLTIVNATHKTSIEVFLRSSHILQDNCPENLKAAFVINAPPYYVFMYAIVKKIMSSAMIKKFHVFGRNGWKEELFKLIDPSVLPACLGGNRTDPDGNPLCLTFLNHGGRVPPKYYLTNEERWFKDRSLVKTTVVSARSKSIIPVFMKQHGSWIKWEFECKSKDIEFGLFFKENEHEIEVIPLHRVTTYDGTETGSYKTEIVGKYLIIFDNSYSWLNSKEVHYTVTVINPDS